ncbi:MAG: cob(I)yrinic acid a,c-diamide adenosyltransferase [bacterium]
MTGVALDQEKGTGIQKGYRGLLRVYTGEGKGKTTAALGQAIRAASQGKRVLFIQFMKGQETGELKAILRSGLPIDIERFGRPVFLQAPLHSPPSRTGESLDMLLAHQGLEALERAMKKGLYQLIILDEINMAMDFGLLEVREVMRVIKEKPEGLCLILTGRNAPKEVMEAADSVTVLLELKHHYRSGEKPKKGIEF